MKAKWNLLLAVWLLWSYDPGQAPVVFEVWHSMDLVNWSKVAETLDTKLQVAPLLQAEFFKVRARDLNTGLESDWAIK